jgi:3-phosphoglycerate kinase
MDFLKADFKDRRVLLRVDFNIPIKSGKITDDSRIKKSLPTIKHILSQNPKKIIIISHLGRPKDSKDKSCSMQKPASRLSSLLKKKVYFEKSTDLRNLKLPEKKIIVLENLRYDPGEKNNDEDFAKKLASYADVFVFDAFGAAHRAHASVTGIPKYLPSCFGLLMKKEILYLKTNMKNPKKPFIAIIGGAKSDKISIINELLKKVNYLIVAGVLGNTFLKAKGSELGLSKYDEESLGFAKKMLERYPKKIILPKDFITGNEFSDKSKATIEKGKKITGMIMDIGPETIEYYKKILSKAKTVVWAGPIGVFELKKFEKGTKEIAKHLAKLNAVTIIGGGDSGEAIAKYKLEKKMTHVSTGGGASLEMLSGKKLPALKAIKS